jgi:hypothetical protein
MENYRYAEDLSLILYRHINYCNLEINILPCQIAFMRALLFLTLLFTACSLKEQKLDGAYILVAAKYDDSNFTKNNAEGYKTIKVFKNGYWISTSFTEKSIIECYGGAYKIKDEYCTQIVNFNSTDTSVIGKEYSYEYDLDDKDSSANFIGVNLNKKSYEKEVYEKINAPEPLKNTSLEGVWIMKPGQAGYNDKNEIIRIFSFPAFTRTVYNFKEKRFANTYGGTYRFDGKELIEKIEYSNYQIPPGSTMEWSAKKLTGNQIQLFDVDSFNDEEIFIQVNHQ